MSGIASTCWAWCARRAWRVVSISASWCAGHMCVVHGEGRLSPASPRNLNTDQPSTGQLQEAVLTYQNETKRHHDNLLCVPIWHAEGPAVLHGRAKQDRPRVPYISKAMDRQPATAASKPANVAGQGARLPGDRHFLQPQKHQIECTAQPLV